MPSFFYLPRSTNSASHHERRKRTKKRPKYAGFNRDSNATPRKSRIKSINLQKHMLRGGHRSNDERVFRDLHLNGNTIKLPDLLALLVLSPLEISALTTTPCQPPCIASMAISISLRNKDNAMVRTWQTQPVTRLGSLDDIGFHIVLMRPLSVQLSILTLSSAYRKVSASAACRNQYGIE